MAVWTFQHATHDDVVVSSAKLAVHEAVEQRVDRTAQEDGSLTEHVERLAQGVAHIYSAGDGAREVAEHKHQEDGDHHPSEAHLALEVLVGWPRYCLTHFGRRVTAAVCVENVNTAVGFGSIFVVAVVVIVIAVTAAVVLVFAVAVAFHFTML